MEEEATYSARITLVDGKYLVYDDMGEQEYRKFLELVQGDAPFLVDTSDSIGECSFLINPAFVVYAKVRRTN